MRVKVMPPFQLPKTRLPSPAPVPAPSPVQATLPRHAGALYYLARPPAELAIAAQRRLGLQHPPDELLVVAPSRLRHDPELEAAAAKAGLGLLKLVSLELARHPAVPAELRTGVPLAWSVYGAWQLYRRWCQGADIPTLALGVGEVVLDGWGKAGDAGLLPGKLALPPELAQSFGYALFVADTVKDGKDFTMALLDGEIAGASPLYRAARCLAPVLEAALSDDPELAGITLLPLPHRPPSQPT